MNFLDVLEKRKDQSIVFMLRYPVGSSDYYFFKGKVEAYESVIQYYENHLSKKEGFCK